MLTLLDQRKWSLLLQYLKGKKIKPEEEEFVLIIEEKESERKTVVLGLPFFIKPEGKEEEVEDKVAVWKNN